MNGAKDKIALLFRGKQQDWSFPKGHLELGEDEVKAMQREVKEETGLDVAILQILPAMCYLSSAGENCELKMFLVQAQNDNLIKVEHDSDRVEWVELKNVLVKLSYQNLKDYFKSIEPVLGIY